MTGAEPPVLAVQGLGQRHGRTTVLRGVDLGVRHGERVAVIGPNGAGKTTLFDVISGRMRPSAGSVWLQGRRIDGLAPHRIRRLGLARSFQTSSLFDSLSVYENLRCALLWQSGLGHAWWRRLSRAAALNARADALLHTLGLGQRRDAPARALSYAEQRLLEVGMAVAGDASVLLLDEPTAGMSRSETAGFLPLLRRLTEGRTLLMVEHDMSVVFDLADRVAVLAQGELIAFGTPAAVRADPRVQAAYLGVAPGAGSCEGGDD